MNKNKVLIVDDDPDIVKALALRLRAHEFEVSIAGDANQALMKFRQKKPDLILMDIMMPAGDGFSVFEKMQAFPDAWNIPVIFLTADTSEQSREKAKELGARFYVTKPYEWKVLLENIEEALNGSN